MKIILRNITNAIFIIFLLFSMFSNVLAVDFKTSLKSVKNSVEKNLENDQGYISKTIVDLDKDKGEVTIELKLANEKKQINESQKYKDTEIYMIISEDIAKDSQKLSKYVDNIKTLSNKIFMANSKTKIGIIGITGPIRDSKETSDGKLILGDKDQSTVEGTIQNSEIVVSLTDNIDTIINGLKSMNASNTEYYNNLQAAIKLANKSYSDNVNKILISLYDNVPAVAVGVYAQTNYGGTNSEYKTIEEAVKGKHEKIANYTRDDILALKNSNISFILLRPDDTSYDETWYSVSTGEKLLDFDGSPYVKKLYGTVDKPTYGKMYNFNKENINDIITESIYKDVIELIESNISNAKLVDYFPKEIIDNFDFSYLGNPSIGDVSKDINKESNSIEWNINTLKADEIATLKYKLKIKDMKNKNLLNKVIPTNEKVILTYKDINSKDYTVDLSESPEIQLIETKGESVGNNIDTGKKKEDTTVAKGELPKAGLSITIIFGIFLIIILSIAIYCKYRTYKDVK